MNLVPALGSAYNVAYAYSGMWWMETLPLWRYQNLTLDVGHKKPYNQTQREVLPSQML